jgi:CBS domain-containing protein
MSFFLSTNGILRAYQFDYLSELENSNRLDKTKVHADKESSHAPKMYFEQVDLYAVDIMNCPVFSMQRTSHLDMIRQEMQLKKIRHVPIVNEKKLLGMISDRDLLKLNLSGAFSFLKAEEIMTKVIVVVEEETPIAQIARVLVQENISALPVINKKHELTGMISRTDILKAVVGHRLVAR